LRDGIGLAAGVTSRDGALDLLLCNVVVIDAVLGIVKGDLGTSSLMARLQPASRPASCRSRSVTC
jgi:urease alpha subunit